ncbi:MAG: hypothetical protein AAF202_06305, partial [Pseudomonadota bacterium]
MKKLILAMICSFGLGSAASACDMSNPEILKFIGLEELAELVCTNEKGPVFYKSGKLAGTVGGKWF